MSKSREDQYVKLESGGVRSLELGHLGSAGSLCPWEGARAWASARAQRDLSCVASHRPLCSLSLSSFFFQVARPLLSALRAQGACLHLAGRP